jgi:hypothetical protein
LGGWIRGIGSAGGLNVAAITRVYTIAYVAGILGENEDWLFDISIEMEPEDGRIWVIGSGDEQDLAFTDFGIENLAQIVEIYKASPTLMAQYPRPE